MKRVIAICLTLVLVFSLCACGQSDKPVTEKATEEVVEKAETESAKSGFTMGVVVKVDVPWFDRLNQGLQRYAEEYGCTINLYAPSSPDASQQVAYIEDLIAQQVDVIGIIPVSTEALETVLQKARDQGIVVVSHEAPTLKNTDADVEAFTDEAFGEFFMQSLAKAMNYEGEYATIIESLMNPNHNIWTDSAIAYQVANYPDMTCVSSKNETNADVSQAQSICEELMKTYPNLKGIMGTGSADIVGAGLAIENKGMIGKIASVGCTSPADAAQYLESGSVSMIGLWDPANAGYAMCKLAQMVIDGTTTFEDGVDLGIEGYNSCSVHDKVYVVGNAMMGCYAGDDVSGLGF